MTIPTHDFHEVLPDGRYRFRVDHHLINDFNTCDRYFQFRHRAYRDTSDPSKGYVVWASKTLNFPIAVGQWWSSVMERCYDQMSKHEFPTEHHMWKFATDAWGDHDMELYANTDPEVFDKFGGLNGAHQMAGEYYEAFVKQHWNSWRIIGVELGFGWRTDALGRPEMFLGEDDQVVVYYGGKPDMVIVDMAQNMLMPLDHKTKDQITGVTQLQFKPHPQTAGYIWAARQMLKYIRNIEGVKPPTKCVIMVAARNRPTEKPRKGVRKPRFMPVYPAYSEAEIEEWRLDVIEKCRRLRDSIEREVWTPRESACHLFYHGCIFRRVCSTPPNSREQILKADFQQVKPWVPYNPEED